MTGSTWFAKGATINHETVYHGNNIRRFDSWYFFKKARFGFLHPPPATLKSPIWEHFGFRTTEDNGKKIPVSSDTTCKHCFAGVSYNSGNTSNMTTHMKMHHPCIDLSVRNKNIPHSQLRLQDAVRVKMSVNSPQALNISRAIGKFIATDGWECRF